MDGWAIVENGKPLQRICVATPEPTGEQVLLEVAYCGVCHSDLHLQDGYYNLGSGKRMNLTDRAVKLPLIPGHEVVGRVVAFGPDAKDVAVGDRRIVYPWAGCGKCARCRAGTEQLCHKSNSLGVQRHGGYGSHVMVDTPAHLVDFGSLDPALAATYACSGITAYSAIQKLMPLAPDDPVVVIGGGGLGMVAISILKALGLPRIIVVEIDPVKREQALQAGAAAVVDGQGEGVGRKISAAAGAPVLGVIDFVGSEATATAGIDALNRGGTYVLVGLYGGDIKLSLPLLPLRGIAVRGSYTGSLGELKALLELAKAGKLAPVAIEHVPHANAAEALERLRRGGVPGRQVLDASLT